MKTALLVLLLCVPLSAQQKPVVGWADDLSYATAAVNPAWAAVDAWKSPDRACRFGQLAISEALGNGLGLTLQHFVFSPRPCLGCPPHGWPSEHVINSAIGFSDHAGPGLVFTFSTAALRVAANRHTWNQALTGMGIGIASDFAGKLLRCKE